MKKKIVLIVLFIILLLGVGGFLLYQNTELFGKKLVPLKIQSIAIQYTPGYDIGTAEQLNTGDNKVIDIQTISLKESDLKTIKKKLRMIKKSKKKNEELYLIQYKLILNDKTTIKVGNGVGDIEEGKEYTPITIPNSLIQVIEQIIDKNNKDLLKTLSSENITARLDGASITIKNKDNIQYINDYLEYYPIRITEDFKKYDGGYKITLVLDNNIKVYLYNDHVGYISQKEGETDTSTYGVFTNNLYDLINDIYEISTK